MRVLTLVKSYADPSTRYHVQRRSNSEIPFKWVWRTVHGRRMRVRLYPPAGDPELLSVEERNLLDCADGGS